MTLTRPKIIAVIFVVGLMTSYASKPQQVGKVAVNASRMATCTIMQVRDKSYHEYECEIKPHNIALIRM